MNRLPIAHPAIPAALAAAEDKGLASPRDAGSAVVLLGGSTISG